MLKKLLGVSIIVFLFCFNPVFGQYYDWGRSPQNIKWNQLKTNSGKIVYPDYYELGANRLATYVDSLKGSIGYGFERAALKFPMVLHTENFNSNGLVIWAPKRMELEVIPPFTTYASPWLKQLSAHEARHTVQYGNLYHSFMKPVSWLLGQQSGLLSLLFIPLWVIEGDATVAETQMLTYGRGLQPSFSIEYRAYMDRGGIDQFALDKWFCGSYKDFMPNHYQLGYQVVSWSNETYGKDIWSKVANYSAKYPYTILTTHWALKKYYKTSPADLLHKTFADLSTFWKSLPKVNNSTTSIPTKTTSYTTYDSPMQLNDTLIVVYKSDFDRAGRFVLVNSVDATEKHLLYTGRLTTPPLMKERTLYWSEYKKSLLWEQRVSAKAYRYNLDTKSKELIPRGKNAFYPTPLSDGEVATVGYDYAGSYYIEFNKGLILPIADTLSVHGLAYDETTKTLAFIGLSDAGMGIYGIDEYSGETSVISQSSYVSINNLRAGAGRLAFNSIASGKDEVHILDLASKREYQLTNSRYGSFSPSAPTSSDKLYMTTYSLDGYLLAEQDIVKDSLIEVSYSSVPKNIVNPPRRKWDVINLDKVSTIRLAAQTDNDTDSLVSNVDSLASSDTIVADANTTIVTARPAKKYRKALHLFNVHSWTPWSFDPFNLVLEDQFDILFGVTAMSQDLLSSTTGFLSYGYTPGGNRLRGLIKYGGLAPKIEVGFDYGGGEQYVYGQPSPQFPFIDPLKKRFQLMGRVSLPMNISSGYWNTVLSPGVEILHYNALIYNPTTKRNDRGYQRAVASLSYSGQVKMAPRDILPRWGYTVKLSSVSAPFNDDFGSAVSLYGRAYVPGILPHHSLVLSANAQSQSKGVYQFFYKELYPRGVLSNVLSSRYTAFSADYQFPLCYPDGGINGIIYFNRIRLNAFFDFARLKEMPMENGSPAQMGNITSYGGQIFFDMRLIRMETNTTTIGVYIYKPSTRKGVVAGVNLSLPI